VTDKSRISTIIFDADGVVVDSEKMWDRAQAEFALWLGVPYEPKKLKPLIAGRSQSEAVEILRAEYGIAGDTTLLVIKRMELVKAEFKEGVQFVPGFAEFFQHVKSDYGTCIATSMPEELLAIVDAHLGLSKLFGERIFSLQAVGYRSKPNPDLFLHAARQLGATPANCLVIEDAPNGVEAAKRAGMKCVALTTTFARPQLSRADHVVEAFAEINPAVL